MTIIPDNIIDDIIVIETSMLLLPGADTWNDPKHEAILVKASELLSVGVFESNTLESWYNYFNTGDSKYFFELMQTLPSDSKN